MKLYNGVFAQMVRSIYDQFRQSGYSPDQIAAVGSALVDLARFEQVGGWSEGFVLTSDTDSDEDGLLLVGSPDGFSCFCAARH
ncbi:MAG: hypothetical protein D6806_02995 [Deltaproteobacteria bacterium]|nr:MAG: hypothetical protein D6806_02995 [Deltaproteobacteria bacterium]